MLKRSIVAFLCYLIAALLFLSACASKDSAASINEHTTGNDTSDTVMAAEEIYIYPDENYNGEDFNILNVETTWGFYPYLDFENMTGDVLDDTIYTRNRFIEDKFNIKLIESMDTMDTIAAKIKTLILAGDDVYEAMYCRGDNIGPLVSEGYFYNLFDIPELNLNEAWWDQTVIKEGSIGKDNALYFAASDLNLIGFQGTWMIYFNENMLTDLGLDMPYELVRNGKWTLDELQKYMKAGASLNGATSFAWEDTGKATYGLSSFNAGAAALLIGTGERFILKDQNGIPYFSLETERFYSASEKIANMLGTAGEYLSANIIDTPFHFENMFMAGRALFIAGEVKASETFRDMDDTFGVAPIPKYNEDQSKYYCIQFQQSLLLTIPVTNKDTQRSGIILDALSYQSYIDLMPAFYDVTVSQKGLRNEDSIEMLGIIRDSRFFNVGMAYGWISTLYESMRNALDSGNSDMASLIAKDKDAIEANITKFMETITK